MERIGLALSFVCGTALICVFALVPWVSFADEPDGESCHTCFVISQGESGELIDDFANYRNDHGDDCYIDRWGPDFVFWVNQAAGDTLTFTFENLGTISTEFVWWVMWDCLSPSCVLADYGRGNPGQPETWRLIGGDGYYLVFGAYLESSSFPFKLSWSSRQDTSPVERTTWGRIKAIYMD